MGLLLDAVDVDVDGQWRWRWALRDAGTGDTVAEHQVTLDPDSDEVTAFGNLHDYALWHESPDYWRADEVRIMRQAGTWAGRALLGEVITAAITAAAPVTVRVSVPEALDRVLLWPLELAYAGDAPLASRGDVAFVYDIEGVAAGEAKDKVAGALRMLAVFCLPAGTRLAAIRAERYKLSRLIRRLAERDGLAIELRVLQYGVSRERLAGVIAGDDGWDIVYLASHGGRGRFGLERPDGTADWIDTAALMRLLRPTRHRVKLAMVWTCLSAAEEAAAPSRLIDPASSPAAGPDPSGASRVMGLAQGMVRELGCAVVATRYEVPAECPAQFNEVFFESLLTSGQAVDEAAALALAALWNDPPPGERAVNAACPGVFGAPAVGLRLPAPRSVPRPDPAGRRAAPLPAEPERFVGRAAIMAQASAALAAGSGKAAVIFHGMPGTGATTCAVELAYRYADSFSGVAFWRVPAQEADPGGALADFAAALRAQLGDGVPAAPAEPGGWRWRRYAARLRRALRRSRLLIVIDGLGRPRGPGVSWRDPRWRAVFRALVSRGGAARVVLTGLVAPVIPGGKAALLPVLPLTRAEAHALVRELPALHALIWDNSALPSVQDRVLVREMLGAAGGHPALLALMDAAAADRGALGARLAAARNAADEATVKATAEGNAAAVRRLFAFLGAGATAGPAGALRGAIAEWVTASVASTGQSGQLMAGFLSCLAEEDRRSSVIADTWPGLWRRLGHAGQPPLASPLLERLASTKMQPNGSAAHDGQGSEGAYQLHPLVAETVRQAMAPRDRELVDAELAAYWSARESMAALPYLARRRDWDGAAALVRAAARPQAGLGAGGDAVPALRRVADVTGTPAARAALGLAVWAIDRAESRRLLEESIAGAAAEGDYRLAWIVAGNLADLLVRTSRLAEALAVAGQRGEHARIAGLGPCTRLSGQAQRLRIEGLMGRHEQVLAEAAELRTVLAGLSGQPPAADDGEAEGWWRRLSRLPGEPGQPPVADGGDELVEPWTAREGILDAAGASARATGKWQLALDFGAEITASQRLRGASATVIARQEATDAGTLIRLGRLPEAAATLVRCQQAAKVHNDRLLLCDVLSARADLEDARNDPEGAVELERDSVGVRYGASADPGPIAASHRRLARFLHEAGQSPAERRAHLLAAALIGQLSASNPDTSDIRELASLKWAGLADAVKVLTVADVVRYADRTDGVRLAELLATLAPDPGAIDSALVKISWLIAAGRINPVIKAVGGLVRKLTDEPPAR